jgi:hypothetical protein
MTTARSALLTAFMLGRSGHKRMDWLEDMVKKVEENDSAAWREIAVLRREVASLRKEVEASRPHKVVAMGKLDANRNRLA